MQKHWIQTELRDTVLYNNDYAENSIGSRLKSLSAAASEKPRICLLGICPKGMSLVRQELFNFSWNFSNIELVDLGEFRKDTHAFILPVLRHLVETNQNLVLIGGAEDRSGLITRAFGLRPHRTAIYLSESTEYLQGLEFNRADLSAVLGTQAHICSTHQHDLECVSLGRLRETPENVEPIVRRAAFMSVHISAMRWSDAPAQISKSSSGLHNEELCQILRFAGYNEKMNTVGFSGFDHTHPGARGTANIIAQSIWYYLQGFNNRWYEDSSRKVGLKEFVVQMKEIETPLSFLKSEQSGRWWLSLSDNGNKQVYPCAYQDYVLACEGTLSDPVTRFLSTHPA